MQMIRRSVENMKWRTSLTESQDTLMKQIVDIPGLWG